MDSPCEMQAKSVESRRIVLAEKVLIWGMQIFRKLQLRQLQSNTNTTTNTTTNSTVSHLYLYIYIGINPQGVIFVRILEYLYIDIYIYVCSYLLLNEFIEILFLFETNYKPNNYDDRLPHKLQQWSSFFTHPPHPWQVEGYRVRFLGG